MTETGHADVVVIGGGSAAHESAVAAKHYGAGRVIMLEKAPESQSGGNARFSGTGFRWAFDDVEELREVTGTSPEQVGQMRLMWLAGGRRGRLVVAASRL